MFNAAFRDQDIDAKYTYVNIGEDDLPETFRELCKSGVSGFSVTIPHKVSIIPLLEEIEGLAASVGAVNTVKKNGADYVGYNTDVSGIVSSLGDIKVYPRVSAVVGTGGVARAFCAAMKQTGCKEVHIISRRQDRAVEFSSEMSRAFKEVEFGPFEVGSQGAVDLVFNGSPQGPPTGTQLPLDSHTTVFDAVYTPEETPLVKMGRKLGCKVVLGREMLLQQAIATYRVFTGRAPEVNVMRSALMSTLQVKAN